MVDLNQNFRKFLLGYKDKATVKKLPENYEIMRGGKRWHSVAQGGICHPMPSHGYGPALLKSQKFKVQSFNIAIESQK